MRFGWRRLFLLSRTRWHNICAVFAKSGMWRTGRRLLAKEDRGAGCRILRRHPTTNESVWVAKMRGPGARFPARRDAVYRCGMVDASSIRARYAAVGRDLNERARRLFGAAEARTAGTVGSPRRRAQRGLARRHCRRSGELALMASS